MKRSHLADGNMEGCGNLTYKKTICLQTKNSKFQMPSGPFSCGGTHVVSPCAQYLLRGDNFIYLLILLSNEKKKSSREWI